MSEYNSQPTTEILIADALYQPLSDLQGAAELFFSTRPALQIIGEDGPDKNMANSSPELSDVRQKLEFAIAAARESMAIHWPEGLGASRNIESIAEHILPSADYVVFHKGMTDIERVVHQAAGDNASYKLALAVGCSSVAMELGAKQHEENRTAIYTPNGFTANVLRPGDIFHAYLTVMDLEQNNPNFALLYSAYHAALGLRVVDNPQE